MRHGINAQETASNKSASSATAHNLGGAETGRQTLVAAVGDGNHGLFMAQEVDGNNNPAGAWELFYGVLTDATPDTLTRAELVASSSGSFIDWSGTGVDAFPLITAVFSPAHDSANWAEVGRVETFDPGASYLTFGAGTFDDENYDYRVQLRAVRRDASYSSLRAELYDETTSAWLGTADYYSTTWANAVGNYWIHATTSDYVNVTGTYVDQAGGQVSSTDTPEGLFGELRLYQPRHASSRCIVDWNTFFHDSYTSARAGFGFGRCITDADAEISGVRFFLAAGDIEGRLILERRRVIMP